ncbi:MAG: hypothetical protein RLN72_14650 [Henriciella sp.]
MVTARSYLLALASAAVFTLSACGGSSGLTPTLGASAPEVEQDGSLVNEFIAICGDIVINGTAPASAIEGFDWERPVATDMEQMAAMGGYAADKSDGAANLQVIPLDFPHLKGINCMVSALDPMTVDMAALDPLETLDGFLGEVEWVGSGSDRTELGRFSAIAEDGAVVTINVIRFEDGRFMTLSMTRSKPVAASGSEANG